MLSAHRMLPLAASKLPDFLCHPFPKVYRTRFESLILIHLQIRADTAEALFNLLSTSDLEQDTAEVEEILLETEWCVRASTWHPPLFQGVY
jgi:hypothetical protein